MPRLPGEIHRAIEETTERKDIGEEGTAHKITLDNAAYWAKKWRGRHHPEKAYSMGPHYAEETEWKTSVSPFWHKVVSSEARLIHEALPDLTLRVEASYDPRVSPHGTAIDFQAGRPVSLTQDVQGDPTLRKQRDMKVKRLYNQTWEGRKTNELGFDEGAYNKYDELILWQNADEEIADTFGDWLGIRRFITSDLRDQQDKDWLVKKVHEAYPDTDVDRMVRAGVIPVHAEVNYIPTGQSETHTTKGIFIESAIFDEQRLIEALVVASKEKNPNSFYEGRVRELMEKRLERYYVMRKIDALWDQVYYQQKYREGEQEKWFWDSRLGTALYQALDAIRERYDQEGFIPDDEFDHEAHIQLSPIIYPRSLDEALASCKEFETFVREFKKK